MGKKEPIPDVTSESKSNGVKQSKTNGTTNGTTNSHPVVRFSEKEDPYERDKLHSKYWRSLQSLKPVRLTKRKCPAPVDNANVFSFITFSWLTQTIVAAKNNLTPEDIPPLSKYDASQSSSERLYRLYDDEANKINGVPSIRRAVFRYIRTRMIASSIAVTISVTLAFAGPAFLVSRLIGFSDQVNPSVGYGIGLVCGLGCTEFGRSLLFATFWAINYRTAIRARAGVLTMVFKKIAR
uniref:ABC transmembrane type-1 domain-containing protein n=2 Tax=Ciona intestinalis TaxID=7719 RepID=H2XYS4_CIOIN